MKSIDFHKSNNVLPTKSGPMPVFIGASGEIISRWSLTWREIWQIIRNRAIFVTQYPQSVAFPQVEIQFRELSEEEKAEFEKREKQARVAEAKAKRKMKVRR